MVRLRYRAVWVLVAMHGVGACLSYDSYASLDASGSYLLPTPINAAAAIQGRTPVQIALRRADGQPIAGVDVRVEVSGAGTADGALTWLHTDATGSATAMVPAATPGAYGLQLAIRQGSFAAAVPAAAAGLNVFAPGPAPGVPAGTPLHTQVLVLTPEGARRRDYAGTLHFRATDPLAVLPPDTTLTAQDAGCRLFENKVTLYSLGEQTLIVSDVATGSVLATQIYTVVPPFSSTFAAELVASRTAGLTADGVDATELTVTVTDGTGTPRQGIAVDLQIFGSGNQFPTDLITDAQGRVTAELRSTVAETKSIAALVHAPGADVATRPLTVVFSPGAVALARSSLVLSPNNGVVADGSHPVAVTVLLRDALDNPIGDSEVVLSSSGSLNTLMPTVLVTDASGTATATWTSTRAEAKVLTAAVPGALTLQAPATFVAGPPASSTSTLTALATQCVADGSQTLAVTATLLDAFGNPVTQHAVVFTVTGQNNTLMPQVGLTDAAGRLTTLLASTASQNKVVLASSGSTLLQLSVSFVPQPCPISSVLLLPQPPAITMDSTPTGIVAADFNRDGQADFATVHADSSSLRIYAGHGDGTFAHSVTYATGSSPQRVLTGDITGDGKMDVAVYNAGDGTVGIYAGHGDNTFDVPVTLAVGGIGNVALADVNRDGKLDVATLDGGGTLNVYLGQPGTTFTLSGTFMTGSGGHTMAIGDVNNDGKLDAAVGGVSNTDVAVLLGDGAGGFLAPVTYTSGHSDQLALTLADFNQDGAPDILISHTGTMVLTMLENGGDGSFDALHTVQTSANPNPGYSLDALVTCLAADFNRDSKMDFACLNNFGFVEVMLNQGAFAFALPALYPTGANPATLELSDINNDGRVDALITNNTGATVTVLKGRADGSFDVAKREKAGIFTYAVHTADLNRDGAADLMATNLLSNDVSVFINQGNNAFSTKVDYPVGSEPLAIDTGDFNGDTIIDMAVANGGGNSLSVLIGIGDGTFKPQVVYDSVLGPASVVAKDVDQDNRIDLLVIENYVSGVTFFRGQGDGTFVRSSTTPMGETPYGLATADLNGDSHVDLVVTDPNLMGIDISLGHGDGTFAAPELLNLGSPPSHATLADFNGDGHADIAAALLNANVVSVMLGHGDGTFSTPSTYPTNVGPFEVAAADVNGDGILDLVAVNSNSYTLSLFIGLGDGTFNAKTDYMVGSGPVGITQGDFNGDNIADLAISLFLESSVTIMSRTACIP